MRLLALLVLLLGLAPPGARAESGELLYSTEGNRLRRIDVDTLGSARPAEEILIERAGQGPGADENPGRDVNGMICALPDGSGRFVLGEDAAADPGCVDDRDASEVLGDLDYDNDVDLRDRDLFIAAFGHVPGEVGYRRAADLAPAGAPDEVIDLADYRAWTEANLALNGIRPPEISCELLGLELLWLPLLARRLRRR
jgi:hypothetical protein